MPVLKEISRLPNVRIMVQSDVSPRLGDVPFEWLPWSVEDELPDLQRFDVGIMPLEDDKWSRGKCSMKALLYMAIGIPAVCSPVGMNSSLIQHGKNGMLADSPDEWVGVIKRLSENPTLRGEIGRAGRLTVEQEYSDRVCAQKFAKVLRAAAANR